MKKKIILTMAILVAVSFGIVGMSAFEAHVINVTAQIENALTVPVEASGMSFGTVFPEEVAFQNLDIQLSSSFIATDRVDDIEYMIRQKPKCGVPIPESNPVAYSSYPQVTENSDGNFICPMVTAQGPTGGPEQIQSVMLPLLCPYLSKHEVNGTGGIDAFHGPLTGWTMDDTLATQVNGRLSKADGKTSTSWIIDLHAPCFQGLCAQDNVIPDAYQADPAYEGQLFGCDLWVEVSGVSLNGPGTLTVTKNVVNTGGGTKGVGDFPLFVDGFSVTSGIATTTSAGSHTITETSNSDYIETFGADCPGGVVNVPISGGATCTITNTFKGVPPGRLTVTKIVSGSNKPAGDFPLFVDGMSVTTGVATTTSAGNHTVTETADTNYIESFGADCPGGIVNVPTGGSATCTITNTIKNGNLTVTKVVIGGTKQVTDFPLFVDGNSVTSGIGTTQTPGNHTVTETTNTDYNSAFSGNCDAGGIVNVPANGTAACTITNTRKVGNLKVIKVVENPGDLSGIHSAGDFQMRINGGDVIQNQYYSVPTGNNTVSEANDYGYVVTYSAECSGGVANISEGANVTCTITNTVPFGTITVTKNVVNNDGGNKQVASFTLKVNATTMTSGVSKNFALGTYTISETGSAGYVATFIGDCNNLTHSITIAAGNTKSCTITNDDIAPVITLFKIVSGGSASPNDFFMRVDGTSVPHDSSIPVMANTNHKITEDAFPGYEFTNISGLSCPTALDQNFTLTPGQSITCTITNTANNP